jgi:hypothetical protein
MSKNNKKFDFLYVENYFKEQGCTLLEDTYVNSNTKMKYICICNKESEITFYKFKSGQRCRGCSFFKSSEKQRLSIDYIREFFNKHDCILLSDRYINNYGKLEFICKCQGKSTTTWATFKNSKSCANCGYAKTAEKIRKFDYNYVYNYLIKFGYELLEESYKNPQTAMKCKCPNGHETSIEFRHFQNNVRCRECYLENTKGENNPNWNPLKTDEERLHDRVYEEYRQWRDSIYKRDNYTCQCCGLGNKVNAHHLNGYHWAIDERTTVENGITLCESCHDDFHNAYGHSNNTKEQFEEYMEGISWNCMGIYKDINLVV